MKKIIFAAIIACTALVIPAKGQNVPYIDMNTTVEREVTPDELYIRITINENDYKGKSSLEQMQSAMISVLMANKVDIPECLTLNYMGSDISYTKFMKNIKPKSEATYTLKLNDVIAMQKIIAALEERQISNIALVKLRYSKENELKASMAVEAMRQAQSEARTLAGAVGQEIGKAISINSWMNGGEGIQPRLYKARSSMADNAVMENREPAHDFGVSKLTYRFNVNVRFELK